VLPLSCDTPNDPAATGFVGTGRCRVSPALNILLRRSLAPELIEERLVIWRSASGS
jgi:hypothetical protein